MKRETSFFPFFLKQRSTTAHSLFLLAFSTKTRKNDFFSPSLAPLSFSSSFINPDDDDADPRKRKHQEIKKSLFPIYTTD